MDNNDDRLEFGTDNTPKMNDDYFDSLYDDLPKEIADLLKSNHPFAENDSHEETLEEKRARRAAMRKEAKAAKRSVKWEEPELVFEEVNEPKEEAVEESKEESEPKKVMFDESAVIKKAMEEAHISAPIEEEPATEEPEEEEIEEAPVKKGKKKAKAYDDDFDEDDKEAALKRFFDDDDDYYDDEKGGIGKVIVIILLIVAIVAAGFFAMQYMSLKGELASYTSQTEEIEKYKSENDELKLQLTTLEDEIGSLKAENEALKAAATQPEETNEAGNETTAPAETTPSSNETTYTVKDGDSYWSIAAKVYGDGTKYQKILDANGLKESDDLSIGQTLKIPAL